MLNKVPEITLYFWIIKILCTTVGETAADYLNVSLNLGLTGTSIVTGILLVIALFVQFKTKQYVPATYWIAVMLISVFGTLVTDNLTDAMGVPLEVSTVLFALLLAGTFYIWYQAEKTLSIHSIYTTKRESFYWLAILFTFALGTAAGDLMAEGLALGYATTGLIIAAFIAVFAAGWRLGLNSVLAFWMIYILTRPLGASIGDYLSQPTQYGGLGLGATITSIIFVGGILAMVTYLSVTKKDVIEKESSNTIKQEIAADEEKGGLWQTAVVVALLLVFGLVGYQTRQSALEASATTGTEGAVSAATASPAITSSDLAGFITISQDTLDLLNAGDQSGATKRIADLESEWDMAQSTLKPKDKARWNELDGRIDDALSELRSRHPDITTEKTSLETLIASLQQT